MKEKNVIPANLIVSERLEKLCARLVPLHPSSSQYDPMLSELYHTCRESVSGIAEWLMSWYMGYPIEERIAWDHNRTAYRILLDSHVPLWLSDKHFSDWDIVAPYLFVARHYIINSRHFNEPLFPTFLFSALLCEKIQEQEYEFPGSIDYPILLPYEDEITLPDLAEGVLTLLAPHIHARAKSRQEDRSNKASTEAQNMAENDTEDKHFTSTRFVDEDFLGVPDNPSPGMEVAEKNKEKKNPYVRICEDFPDSVSSTAQTSVEHAASQTFNIAGNAESRDPSGINKIVTSLYEEFPHFEQLIAYVHGQLLLLRDSVFFLPPILLLGKPAIGKTRFWERFSALIGVPFAAKSMVGVSAGFVLTGTDPTWSRSRMGFVAETFLRQQVVNPFIFLDEVDKSSGDYRYNVEQAMLELLEPQTARRFRDEHIPNVELDISKMSFLATANDISSLSEPTLSRFSIFDIPEPDATQRKKVINIIYQELVAKIGAPMLQMDTAVLDFIAQQDWDFRQIRHHLRFALGEAFIRRASPDSLKVEDFQRVMEKKPIRLGFTL